MSPKRIFNFLVTVLGIRPQRKMVVRTIHVKKLLSDEEEKKYYDHFATKTRWESGIKTRTGESTRQGAEVDIEDYPELLVRVCKTFENKYVFFGGYLNWYKDGTCWTPNHSHKGTVQIVLSFGATRTLMIGKKACKMEGGDAILFGSSIHGVPKEPDCKDGRISLAFFAVEQTQLFKELQPVTDAQEVTDAELARRLQELTWQ
jgi:hypothetical protein